MKNFTVLIFLVTFASLTAYSQLSQSQVDVFFERFTDRTTRLDELFDISLLEKVPVSQLVLVRDDFENKYGKYVKAEILSGNQIEVSYEKAVFPCLLRFEPDGKASTLWFGAPSFKNDNIEQIKQEINALKGVASICIRKDGKEIYSLKKDIPLAVGSTFKLFVLKALEYKIQSGELSMNDTIVIKHEKKSLPSGILQNWPDNEPLTISSAANLMISISDNTATDLLIDKIGREYIERYAPSAMIPFLKTREMFIIKLGRDSSFVNNYLNSDLGQKREILKSLDTANINNLNVYDFTTPKFLQVEWYASTEELCKTIESLKDHPALSINAGILDKKNWNYIAFKGGSEPGVLNYTYLVRKKDTSPLYSISATINNNESTVDSGNDFTILIKRIIELANEEN